MRKFYVLAMLLFCVYSLSAQQEPAFSIKPVGFVNYTVFYDSREVVAGVDGLFLLYPAEPVELNGVDINAHGSLTMLSLGTRFGLELKGPDWLGAKTSGKVEADFTLVSGASTVRFRHAYLKLDWAHWSVMAGRSWHPLFVTSCMPYTLGIATGAPFQPFSRTPQLRVQWHGYNLHLLFAVASEMDYASTGPNGPSPEYMRNAVIPELIGRFIWEKDSWMLGWAAGVKSVKPRTMTIGSEGAFVTNEILTSISAKLFVKYTARDLILKWSGLYGENMYDQLLIGGYGVASMDTVTGRETYTSLNGFYSWFNAVYGRRLKGSLLLGYYQNLGSRHSLADESLVWARGVNIDHLTRVLLMATWQHNKVRLGLELELNQAAYGTLDLASGGVNGPVNTSGIRTTFDITWFF